MVGKKNRRQICGSPRRTCANRAGHDRRRADLVVDFVPQPFRNRRALRLREAPRVRQAGSTRPLRPTLHPMGASNSSDRVPFQNPFSERLEAAQLSPSRLTKTRLPQSLNLGGKAAANLAAPWRDISRNPAFSKP